MSLTHCTGGNNSFLGQRDLVSPTKYKALRSGAFKKLSVILLGHTKVERAKQVALTFRALLAPRSQLSADQQGLNKITDETWSKSFSEKESNLERK